MCLNTLLSILNNIIHIFTHIFTHTYIKNIQTILLKLLYLTPPNNPSKTKYKYNNEKEVDNKSNKELIHLNNNPILLHLLGSKCLEQLANREHKLV